MTKILVIEDEDAIVQMLTMAFERYGFSVVSAKDGSEGIERFNKDQFDLVITDIRMKPLNGHVVLRHIRNSHRKFTPTIGMSGTIWDFEHSDFDAIFKKPFAIQSLVETVKNLTSRPLT